MPFMPTSARAAERRRRAASAALGLGLALVPAVARGQVCHSVQKLSAEQYWKLVLVTGVAGERDEGEIRRGHLEGAPETCFEVLRRRLDSVDARTSGYVDGLTSFLDALPLDPAHWKPLPEALTYLQKASRITGIAFVPARASAADVEAGAIRFQEWLVANRGKLVWSDEAGKLMVDVEAASDEGDGEAAELDAATYWTYEGLGAVSREKDGRGERRGRYELPLRSGRFRVSLAALEDREARFQGYLAATQQLVLYLTETGGPSALRSAALARLRLVTTESFETPEQWLMWWVRNRDALSLSSDGKRLLTESR
jgi:hypothetical protein